MKRSGFKRKASRPLKRTRIRKQSKSTPAKLKREIQALLRQIVIKRDGGCLLRGNGNCTEVLQAEHLITRSNSKTYGDLRNIVCLCTYHHLFFKKQHSFRYWQLIEQLIGKVRWKWLKETEADRTPYKADWKQVKADLEKILQDLK